MRAVDYDELSRALQLGTDQVVTFAQTPVRWRGMAQALLGVLLLLQVESVHLGLASDPGH
jgi:hypothetical protein